MSSTVDAPELTAKLDKYLSPESPYHEPFRPMPKKIFDDVIDAVGNTPLVRINRVGAD
jgi:hypothetical protein